MDGRGTRLDFAGKLIVVTGGARGQGAEEARRLIANGARVVLTDLLEAEGRALADELGPDATFFRHDVASEADWIGLMAFVRSLGVPWGLVNNAGIYQPSTIEATDLALFERHVRINEIGCFLGIKHVTQAMGPDGGSIVNVSSIAGLRASPGIAYVASKWALRGMTKTAAMELGPRRIRVNSIHPGIIDTPMLDVWTREHFASRLSKVPLGRAGTVADVAELVLFLLSEKSGYITGAEIAIDGGLSL